jgi:iron complex outermembrane receptor protein
MRRYFILPTLLLCFSTLIAPLRAEDEKLPTLSESIEVTATRVPEATGSVPATITVITGQELSDRGARDLPSALTLVAGLSLSPGSGDAGPAASVPEFYGLREADAFLLVVDGVPWGGAFNPSLTTVDMTNVERIEVMRGAAPVMYGATSFVGVIQIIHRAAGAPGVEARVSYGRYGSGGVGVAAALPAIGDYRQSLSAGADQEGFRDVHTGWRRGHFLYRGGTKLAGGNVRLDFDGTFLRQDPASPVAREGSVFPSPAVRLDANQNPSDARANESRYALTAGFDRKLGSADWSTTLSLTHAQRRNTRGFLGGPSEAEDPNASGFRQRQNENDIYFDSHLVWKPATQLQVVAGLDHLYGMGTVDSYNFDYFVPLDGHGRPSSRDVPIQELNVTRDKRNFSGLYAQAEWTPVARLRFEMGLRVNHTSESRRAINHPIASEAPAEEPLQERRNVTRGGGVAGVNYLVLTDSKNSMWLFADYRNTYKPAATDFGPEIEGILHPETGQSYEAGIKGNLGGSRFDWELSAFHLDFQNVVVPVDFAGLPGKANAHEQRLEGLELEWSYRIFEDLRWQVAYSYHDAEFRDFIQLFDGVPTQLRGNKVEMSAHTLAATGLTWAPAHGFRFWSTVNYVGERFLNKRNTAIAPAYATWSAGLGYRFGAWELQVAGSNINNSRAPVAESEFGDAQYYVLPGRSLSAGVVARF